MKWLPFLLLIMLSSCQYRMEKKRITESVVQINNIETPVQLENYSHHEPYKVWYLFLYQYDTGYFKTDSVLAVDGLEKPDTTLFGQFLARNIDRTRLKILNTTTLYHSCYVTRDTSIRFDTLWTPDKKISITQKVSKDEDKLLSLKINGKPVRIVPKEEWPLEDQFDFNAGSFRHFSFACKEYYYINAGLINCPPGQGSYCNTIYHLLYDVKNNRLNYFTTIRWGAGTLFGDIDGDDKLDFLDFQNEGMGPTIPMDPAIFTMYLYSDTGNGVFVKRKDRYNRKYHIDGNTGHHPNIQDSINIDEYYWPVPLK